MADEFIPELTLTPDAAFASVASAVPAAPTAPAASEKPLPPSELDAEQLSPEERAAILAFAKKIDITNSDILLQYGSAAQKNVSDFSETTLSQVRTKDMGEIGEALSGLVQELQSFEAVEEKKGLAGLFRRKKSQLEAMKTGYANVESNIDRIVEQLEGHQITLMKDLATLDQMFALNAKYQKELTMYILAGKAYLQELQAGELNKRQQTAQETGRQEDAQSYQDLLNLAHRFEKSCMTWS